ncbi:hypothetical protein J3E68DRAFT_391126 [Trichoderma sp. SZMC 28012]
MCVYGRACIVLYLASCLCVCLLLEQLVAGTEAAAADRGVDTHQRGHRHICIYSIIICNSSRASAVSIQVAIRCSYILINIQQDVRERLILILVAAPVTMGWEELGNAGGRTSL